jgi:hypothetical protein
MSELERLHEPEALAGWAHRALPLKDQLSVADAQALEAAFAARLAQLGEAAPDVEATNQKPNGHNGQPAPTEPGAATVSVIRKPVRDRDRDHLRFVAAQPCLVCGRTPSDPHHIKFAEQRGMGRKVSDRFTVPICRLHHRELHRRGNERAWWQNYGIDPLAIAATIWSRTHPPALPASLADDTNPEANFSVASQVQNDETKPIVRPEAG